MNIDISSNVINDLSYNVINHLSSKLIKTRNNQIFKYLIPKNIVKELFYNIKKLNNKANNKANNNLKQYNIILNKIIYKKLVYNNFIKCYIEKIKKYYYKKKIFYFDRKMTYKHFLTIIRQICNLYKIPFENKLKYYNSKYEIYYNINIHPIINACK